MLFPVLPPQKLSLDVTEPTWGKVKEIGYTPNVSSTSPSKTLLSSVDAIDFIRTKMSKKSKELITPHYSFLKDHLGVKALILAGGCFYRGEIKDLDIWPFGDNAYINISDDKEYLEYTNLGIKLQLCKSPVCKSVEELVEGFDFAHCKVGVRIYLNEDVSKINCFTYVSPDFIAAMALQSTYYCGKNRTQHGNPLRSLRRLPKVALKLELTQEEVMSISNDIVNEIVKQGTENLKLTSLDNKV
jgi:hypothetical protein